MCHKKVGTTKGLGTWSRGVQAWPSTVDVGSQCNILTLPHEEDNVKSDDEILHNKKEPKDKTWSPGKELESDSEDELENDVELEDV